MLNRGRLKASVMVVQACLEGHAACKRENMRQKEGISLAATTARSHDCHWRTERLLWTRGLLSAKSDTSSTGQ